MKRILKSLKSKGLKYKGVNFVIKGPILDIGGGPGIFLENLRVKKADIIDLTSNQNPKYNYIQVDISKKFPKLPYKKYETIFAMEILEHLRNPLYLMAQVYNLLDDKGTCYVAVPYTSLLSKKEVGKKWLTGSWDNGHVSRWKLKEIKSQMEKVGFKVKVLKKRRRFKNTAFWLPHCWIVLELEKRI
jgi:2-polyprenyl-3-methyl-5-hydroxy-6-metoxy-1,4-benzoquinol methylase